MSKLITKHKSRHFRRFAKANEAVSVLEYSILVGVIVAAVGGAVIMLGGKMEAGIAKIGVKMNQTVGNAVTASTP